jgi:hypothetical protein
MLDLKSQGFLLCRDTPEVNMLGFDALEDNLSYVISHGRLPTR